MKLKIEVTDNYGRDGSLSHWVQFSMLPDEGREEIMSNSAIQIAQIARYFDMSKAIANVVDDFYSSISLAPIADRKERTSDTTV